jgi:predicted dehydrogenase
MNVAIVGCGLIGQKRLGALSQSRLSICVDVILERAEALARQVPGAIATRDWRDAVARSDVEVVIVATVNKSLAEIAAAAIEAGKHVLVEKPAARNVRELETVIEASQHNQVAVRVGFNHRYHRALRQARQLVDTGAIGKLMYVRGRYGHGGRLGYEKEWRADPKLAGGGELLDQGVHLIDLARWFLGDFVAVTGFAHTYYWDMPVEDNGFLMLKTAQQQTAFLHASCTEWKNLFCLEIYGRDGKLQIDGLGGSYGTERLTYYRMLPQLGPPETTIWEYPGPDTSWQIEFEEFLEDIRLERKPSASLEDARAALRIVEQIYARSGLGTADERR